MKKLLALIVLFSLLVSWAAAEALPSPAALMGITDADKLPLQAAEYATGTKIGRGFYTTDAEELAQLAEAVAGLRVAGAIDEYVTDMYPSLSFVLADGSRKELCFNGKWLEVAGQNYALENDEPLWALIDSLLEKYGDEPAARFQPNCTDIYLPSNPTTGFGWQFSLDTPDVISVTDQYFAEQSQEPVSGLGGTHWFHLDGLHPGVAALTLTYSRPWEEGSALQTLVLRVTVDEQLNVLIWGVEME